MQQLKFPEIQENSNCIWTYCLCNWSNTRGLLSVHKLCTWIFRPALFQISPSCYFTFHDVTSKSSYILLGCCQEDYRKCRWVLMGISEGHWPNLYLTVEQKLLVFCEHFLSPPHLSSTYTPQGQILQDSIPPTFAVTDSTIHFALPYAELPVIPAAVLHM